MKKFKFSLDALLALRKNREDECSRQLGLASAECEKARTGLQTIQKDLLSLRQVSDPGQREYNSGLLEKRVYLRKELVNVETIRKQKERLYLDARKEREVLSRLREKRESEFLQSYKKKEEERMNEIGQTLFLRQRQS